MPHKIKSVFITTPQWLPLNPPFTLVPFVSYLKDNGFDSSIVELNIEYYLYILNKKYLYSQIEKSNALLAPLFDYLRKNFKKDAPQESYNDEFRAKLLRYNKIKEFQAKEALVKKNIEEVEKSLEVMRNKDFYNPQALTQAMKNIDFCLEVASLPYFPALIQLDNYSDPFFKLDFKNMLQKTKDNMFLDFYKTKIPEILALKPDLIGVSINSTTQIVSALTLCKKLKQQNKAKILIGGNFFSRVSDTLEKYPEFFENFCDYVMLEEGEIPNLQLCRYLEGDLSISQVANILYLEDKKVKVNPICEPLSMEKQTLAVLDDFHLEKYLTPDIVIPQQASRGCYWGKCSFCDHDFGQKLSLKSPKKFVGELEEISKRYGINHFELIDECISPNYLKQMSELILEKKLDVKWFNNARLEPGFNKQVLDISHRAGLKMLLWGFESASRRIMNLINKGVDFEKRTEILKNSIEAGIWNFAFIFFGFPSETPEEARETIEYIKNHTDIISSYGRSVFTLGKHTTLRQTPEKFNITKIYKDIEEFSPTYHFETSSGMNTKEINQTAQTCLEECNQAYNKPLWMYLAHREILFLYISKYGAKEVRNMKLN